jgi:hypothetical protein
MNINDLITLSALRPTQEVADTIDQIPEVSGVYMVFGDSAEVLEGTGYDTMENRDPFRVAGADLLYVGSSTTLRTRIARHLRDDSRTSSLRMSLGTVLRFKLDLTVHPHLTKHYFDFGPGEARLTRWLCENTAMAIWPCAHALDLEKALIRNIPTPMNISDRRTHPFSRYLMGLRRRLTGRENIPRRKITWRCTGNRPRINS